MCAARRLVAKSSHTAGRATSAIVIGDAAGDVSRRLVNWCRPGPRDISSSRPSFLFRTDWSLVNTESTSTAPVRFPDLGVPRELSVALEQQGITTPFPVQAATLPDCISGRDVLGRAPTGAGKTLAFGLAILTRLATKPDRAGRGRRHPSALVLVPTRELAAQIEGVVTPLAQVIGVRVASIYGGVGYKNQVAAVRNGIDIVIACPGRLTDLVDQRSVDLSHVEMVVLDEADRMADMGFLPVVRRLIDLTRASRQVLLFSATLEGPVDKLIRDYQHHPVHHDVELADIDRGTVHHHFWQVEHLDRLAVTIETISARGPALVFCRTKRGVDRLSDRLARSGLRSAAIHGDRNQSQRDRALAAFRAGRLDVLVATDVAARGIHVDSVPLVVHFDPPADPTDYVHRSGRTGRAGADGIVVSLVGPEHVSSTRLIQRELGLSRGVCVPDVPALACVDAAGPARDTQYPRGRTNEVAVANARPAHAPVSRVGSERRRPRRRRTAQNRRR